MGSFSQIQTISRLTIVTRFLLFLSTFFLPPTLLRTSIGMAYLLINFTLNELEDASTVTAMGPTVATAASKLDSLPLSILTIPEISAADVLSSKKHCPCCREQKLATILTIGYGFSECNSECFEVWLQQQSDRTVAIGLHVYIYGMKQCTTQVLYVLA